MFWMLHMGLLAVILNKAGVSLGWMYLAMGVLIGSAVIPTAFMLLWRKANAIGAILGTVVGCVLGITTWISVTSIKYDGRIDLDTTGRNAPVLAGNLVSILTGGAIHVLCSLVWPQNYEWDTTRKITTVEKDNSEELPAEEEKLKRAKAWIVKWGIAFTLVIVVLWPIFSLPAREFNLGYFTFWVTIAIAWGTIGSAVVIALPLIESGDTIRNVFVGMFTNDRIMTKLEKIDTKLQTFMTIPEAEKLYVLEKGDKAKKRRESPSEA
ncbi:Urea-proton symporter DUR3 [Linum grandiflorum]